MQGLRFLLRPLRLTSTTTQKTQTMAAPALRTVALIAVVLRDGIGGAPTLSGAPLRISLAQWTKPHPARTYDPGREGGDFYALVPQV